eukprot:scaffold489_cov259-Pinguiococcus_pyrenoidosus.AAC.36
MSNYEECAAVILPAWTRRAWRSLKDNHKPFVRYLATFTQKDFRRVIRESTDMEVRLELLINLVTKKMRLSAISPRFTPASSPRQTRRWIPSPL